MCLARVRSEGLLRHHDLFENTVLPTLAGNPTLRTVVSETREAHLSFLRSVGRSVGRSVYQVGQYSATHVFISYWPISFSSKFYYLSSSSTLLLNLSPAATLVSRPCRRSWRAS
mgnify:CR=1 FL=1